MMVTLNEEQTARLLLSRVLAEAKAGDRLSYQLGEEIRAWIARSEQAEVERQQGDMDARQAAANQRIKTLRPVNEFITDAPW